MSGELIATGVVRFGDFELDSRKRELRKSGQCLRLQAKQFQILELLVENSHRLVSRRELRERLWPDTFVQFDRGIYTAVNRLRKALGDTCDTSRYIQTRSRLGYRFVAPVCPPDEWAQSVTWPMPSNSSHQYDPGEITSSYERSSAVLPSIRSANSGSNGAVLRIQLPRGNGELAELSLKLTTTKEGAVSMRIEPVASDSSRYHDPQADRQQVQNTRSGVLEPPAR